MIPVEVEAIYLSSQVLYFARSYIQTKDSLRESRSVNSNRYWYLTILAGLVLIVYSFFIGSWAMGISNVILLGYSFLHMNINNNSSKNLVN